MAEGKIFCTNCGAEIEEGHLFCTECGTKVVTAVENISDTVESKAEEVVEKVEETVDSTPETIEETVEKTVEETIAESPVINETPVYTEPVNIEAPKASSETGKKSIIVIAAVVAVLIIATIFAVALMGGGYKKPIKAQIDVLNKKSTKISDFYAFMPYAPVTKGYYEAYYKMYEEANDMDDDEYLEDFMDRLDEQYDEFEDEYGKNWKISYEIKKAKKLDKDDVEDLQDRWEDWIDGNQDNAKQYKKWYKDIDKELISDVQSALDKIEDKKITAAYKVKVKIIIKGKDGKDTETDEYTVVKLGGKWVLINSLYN